MKKILFYLAIIFSLTFSVINVHAQETSPEPSNDAAKKYKITFPVSELGNCADITTCKTYCNDVSHQEACIGFAKKKGFYKEPQISPTENKTKAMIVDAKTQLGCDSAEACRAFCSQETNLEKCKAFATSHGVSDQKNNTNGPSADMLKKAKETLGCDSPQSCKQICEQEANRDKCASFAKQNKLEGGHKISGPGGCSSEESCRSYCEANKDECMKFKPGTNGGSQGDAQRKGPNGDLQQMRASGEAQKLPPGQRGGLKPDDRRGSNGSDSAQMNGTRPPFGEQKSPEENRPTPGQEQVQGVSTTRNVWTAVLHFLGIED